MPSVIGAVAWKFIVKAVVSYAINAITNKLFGPKTQSSSPTYTFGTLQTQTNSGMVMSMIYGKVKCAGNIIWASDGGTIQQKIVSFGVGKIKRLSEVKLSDNGIEKILEGIVLLTVVNNVNPSARCYIYKRSTGVLVGAKKDGDESGFAHGFLNAETIQGVCDFINSREGFTATTLYPNRSCVDLESETLIVETDQIGWCYNNPRNFKSIKVVQEGLPGCSYTAYLGDGEQLIDSRVTGATQEDKAKLVGGLKYDAYLAITATASDKLSGDYNITVIAEGRIVKIYTSPTTYYEDWSDNPAWCFLDFMTSVDGCGMTISETDIQVFLSASVYYNELVNGRKRFTFNMIMDEKKTRQDWLDEILLTCRSYRTYQRGLHGILVDKPEEVSQVFNVKPDEAIETWWQDNAEDVERLQIEYIDPDYEYTKVVAQADRIQLPGETSQFRNKIPLTKKISIYGINNFKQASTEAWFHLNKAQTCPEWIQYTTNKRALNRSIGDVVGVWNPITEVVEEGLPYKRYRVMTMNEPQENNITMVMQEYNSNLYTFQQGSVAPVINVVKSSKLTYTPTASSFEFTQTVASAVWIIDHGLEKSPSVSVIMTNGVGITGSVDYVTLNQLTVTFSSAITGTAYLN